MGIALLVVSTIAMAEFVIIIFDLNTLRKTRDALEYYRTRVFKMVANDNLVEESFAILSEAYGIEEGDLRNYIASSQERKERS